ncbi:hypothetical protein, partial [Lacimonas salitolerans]
MTVTMNRPTIDDILSPKPVARPRIYAYAIADAAHEGLLKVGQTTRDVKKRIGEQLRTAAITNFTIELDEPAERDDGSIFSDHEVRAALTRKAGESLLGRSVCLSALASEPELDSVMLG